MKYHHKELVPLCTTVYWSSELETYTHWQILVTRTNRYNLMHKKTKEKKSELHKSCVTGTVNTLKMFSLGKAVHGHLSICRCVCWVFSFMKRMTSIWSNLVLKTTLTYCRATEGQSHNYLIYGWGLGKSRGFANMFHQLVSGGLWEAWVS